jgi:hypothetical protein
MTDNNNNNPNNPSDKSKSRRRTAQQPDPSVVIKNGSPRNVTGDFTPAPGRQMSPRLGAASISTIRTQPKVYSPQYLDSSLSFPRSLITQNAWNRNYYATNPIVRTAVNTHAAYTTGKFRLVCKEKKILEFFEDMLDKMNFSSTLLEMGIEYYKLGETIPYLELDEDQGTWSHTITHNPDFIRVAITALQKDPIISLVPDESLKRLLVANDPQSRKQREQIPPEVLMLLQKGQDIPLDNFNVSHLKMLSSPYDTRGMSMIVSCYRDLMLFDKIREAKIIQADNFINPLTLVKLGNENYKPTDDDIRQWQEQVLDSTGDQGYTIVTHGLVDIVKISNSGQILDMTPDLEHSAKMIMIGMMMPQALLDQDYGSYANASVSLEVLKDRYKNFQLQLKKWIERKVLAPIAKIQDFYVTKNGKAELIVPTVEFDKINLRETDSYINAVVNQLADPATPGSGKISLDTFYGVLGTDYNTERAKLKMEARDQIVLMKEIQAMQHMDIIQLKTLSENTPIQDTREIEDIERKLKIKKDEGGDSDMSGGGGSQDDLSGSLGDLGGLGGGGSGPSGGAPEIDLGGLESPPAGESTGGEPPPPAEPPPGG